jgi:uncharacterized protein YdbL (DUF1318 family)
MTRLLIFAAAFGLAASAANACDVHQMHTAGKVDETKVASVTNEDAKNASTNMSTPTSAPTDSTVIITDQVPAQAE